MSFRLRTDPIAVGLSLTAVVLLLVAPVGSLLCDLRDHQTARLLADGTRFLHEVRTRLHSAAAADLVAWDHRDWFDNGSATTARFRVTTSVNAGSGDGVVVSFVLREQGSGAELLRTAVLRSGT